MLSGGAGLDLPVRALFLCIGGTPRTGWAEAARDEGYGVASYGAAFAPDTRSGSSSAW